MRYMDLHQGKKPHLLTSVTNNLGLTTSLTYTSSTTFYLADLKAGVPWVTKLPFPVQVLSKVETYDAVSKVRLVRTYAYHHGYYDGVEREFRGFGMVEERDAESFSPSLGQGQLPPADLPPAGTDLLVPPVLTKTWFHTGYWPKGATLEAAFATEYFAGAASPPPTAMPAGLGLKDAREAARALKGQILRQEVYAEDGSAVAAFPYAVSARSCAVTLLQASTERTHASFFTHAARDLDYHFERKVDSGQADDARITHSLVVDVDPFGAVLRSAAVAYPRNPQYVDPDKTEQAALAVTVSEADVFNSDPSATWYRLGVPLEERSFELLGLTAPAYPDVFAFDDVAGPARNAPEIAHDTSPSGTQQKRFLSQLRHLYLHDDLSGPLAYGTVESLALPYQSYAKAFTLVGGHGRLRDAHHGRDAHRGRVRADHRRRRLVDPVAAAGLLQRRLVLSPQLVPRSLRERDGAGLRRLQPAGDDRHRRGQQRRPSLERLPRPRPLAGDRPQRQPRGGAVRRARPRGRDGRHGQGRLDRRRHPRGSHRQGRLRARSLADARAPEPRACLRARAARPVEPRLAGVVQLLGRLGARGHEEGAG